MAPLETLDDVDDADVGLGPVEEVGECWAGVADDEGLTIFFGRGRVREKTSTRSESFQPPWGDLIVLWPEELSGC